MLLVNRARFPRFVILVGSAIDRDPTRSMTLRRSFEREATRRLRRLKKAIREVVGEQDALGLTERQPIKAMAADFTYFRSADKVEAFMGWLREQEEAGILETSMVPSPGRGVRKSAWSDAYIQSAYKKGLVQARMLMRQAEGLALPAHTRLGLEAAFNSPIHADPVALIYTRVYNELKGVTGAMDQQISRVLARGIAEGIGPHEMARRMNDRVDAIGINRARLIARTETIQTLNTAALNEYEAAERLIGDTVKVQWWTALDERVRPHHRERHGVIYTRAEAEPLLGEPNCRCALLPVVGEAGERRAQARVLSTVTRPEPAPSAPVTVVDAVSAEFVRNVQDAYGNLPEKVRNTLADGRYEYKIGSTMSKAEPRLATGPMRGWREGSTFDMSEGCTWGLRREVVLSETRLSRMTRRYEKVKFARFNFTFHHETGHAFDNVERISSRFPSFRRAYRLDVKQLDRDGRYMMSYYLSRADGGMHTREEAGMDEIFATLFSHYFGAPDPDRKTPIYFPRTWMSLKGILKRKGL